MDKPIPIRLPPDLAAWLKAEAERQGRPLSNLMRQLLVQARQRAESVVAKETA